MEKRKVLPFDFTDSTLISPLCASTIDLQRASPTPEPTCRFLKSLLACAKKSKITSLSSYTELYQFITTIKGFGQKTGGLLLRLVAESGICKFADQLTVIPIDRHDIDISYLTKVISTRKPTAQEIKELSDDRHK